MSDETQDGEAAPPEETELVVKRGPLQDSAEWASPDAPPPSSPFRVEPGAAHGATPPEQPAHEVARANAVSIAEMHGGGRPWALIGIMVAMLALAGVAIAFLPKPLPPFHQPLVATMADLAPVHAGVTAAGQPVRVLDRVGVGTPIETDASGRARIRLDTGTTVIVDRSTKLTMTDRGVDLAAGRVFVVATDGTKIGLGDAVVSLSGSAAAFEKTGDTQKVYAANGDLSVREGSADVPVHVGESGAIAGGKVTVTPERGFDDWTGGMAAPWSAEGRPRRAMGEIWGRSQPGDPGSPLTIRAVNVSAAILGEVARTEVSSTFFNAGQTNVIGDFRMALPKGAIVQRFATERGHRTAEGRIALAARSASTTDLGALRARGDILEWAGDGWLRGTVPDIAPGATVTVVVTYVEWLSPSPKNPGTEVVQYRYPMVGEGAAPLVGEFFAKVDAGQSQPLGIAAGMAARIEGAAVEVRRSDFKPTADLVVDVEMPAQASSSAPGGAPTPRVPARAYLADAQGDDDTTTMLVRTEAPASVAATGGGQPGVTLALVLDTSTSVDPALLDAGKAFVESVVRGLGPNDRVVVLAADQGVRPVGPAEMGPVDEARKKAIVDALGTIEQGGATDLGRSLEQAAGKIPDDAPDGMVVYIGDGWPTLGDLTPEAIRARLARRERGAPRIGAVAVGPSANRLILAALTKDSGPLIEVADTEGASKASVELLENALVPTVTSVSLDLGPNVERVYPRSDLAVRLGSTITYVGTLRGKPPTKIALTYRDAKGLHREERDLVVSDAVFPDDVRRRWAELRVESIALSGGGREATTDAALKASLITPWTALRTADAEYQPTLLAARVLDTAVGPDLGFNAVFATPPSAGGALATPRDAAGFEDIDYPLEGATELSAKRIIDDARSALRSCRDSRAALRPELSGSVQITFKLNGEGIASDVHAQGMSDNDEPLNRCLENVIAGLEFPRSLAADTVKVTYTANFPPPDASLRGRKCSPTSTLDLPLRRGVWRERIDRVGAPTAYLDAKRSCELPNWTAKRSMLELIMTTVAGQGGRATLNIAQSLEDAGDGEAAAFLRKETIRRAAPEDLRTLRAILLANERVPRAELDKQYAAAADDKARLAVVRRFLGFAPHSTLLKKRELALLAALGDKENLVAAVRLVRLDPFADATLIAEGAHLLRKAAPELEDEARRTFFEIAERGPNDPWGRAFLGDRLRAEGWFDEATESYEVLDRLVPNDGATGIRLALAHAGKKRLDVALRILSRIEKTGGRGADRRAALAADRLAHLLIRAAASTDLPPETLASLKAREADFPALTSAPVFVIRTEGGTLPLTLSVERGPDKAREVVEPDAVLSSVGIYTVAMPSGDTSNVTLTLSQPKGASPEVPIAVTIDVLRGGDAKTPLVESKATMKLSGDPSRIGWNGTALAALPDKPGAK